MTLGQRIEKIAEGKGLNAPKLADALGVSKAHIYRILRAEDLSTEVLRKAAEVLGVSLTDFFESEPQQERTIYQTGANQSGGVALVGKNIKQKSLSPAGQVTAGASQIQERLTKCEADRESWERERAALNKVITTQELLITALQTGVGR